MDFLRSMIMKILILSSEEAMLNLQKFIVKKLQQIGWKGL
jgi:hypothetical protein